MRINKDREPIALRSKTLKDGRQSLYLDYYEPERGRNHAHRYEFLKLYLLPDRRDTKEQNRQTLAAANAIKAQRLLDRANGKAGINTPKTKMMLSDYITAFIEKKKATGMSKGRIIIYNEVKAKILSIKADIALMGITPDYLKRLIKMLASSENLRVSKQDKRSIKSSTANGYFNCVVTILNNAVREGLISVNPSTMLTPEDRVLLKKTSSQREFLTSEELTTLNDTPCRTPQLKEAFMFCCFTGLRISDILKLRWSDIYADGDKRYIRMEMTKTKREIIIPLSKTAQSFLPPEQDKLVFNRLTHSNVTRNEAIKRWAKKAGITKDICFHVSRHTFATSLLTQGADLYTTSKLLGHTNIKTTQIYAEIVDKKKEEAVNLLDNINLN